MPKMTEQKESSPESSSSMVSSERSGSSVESASASTSSNLHLQVPLQTPSNSDSTSSSQSSPRLRTGEGIRRRTERGSSSSSSLSMGQISYREVADIQEEFKIVKVLHDGSFSKILLAKQDIGKGISSSGGSGSESHGDSDANDCFDGKEKTCKCSNNKYLVLKALPSGGLFTEDFKRELGFNYFLSPHPNIVTSFNISFNWASSYNVYVQEHASYGDLSRCVGSGSSSSTTTKKCLPECQVKLIARQIASAIDFLHSFKLVHQDLRAENILVFKSNFSRVKLTDFGSTRKEGTLITKGSLISSSSSILLPPELCYLLPQERYECHRSCDVWQMGILLCLCLTGSYPWDNADFSDSIFRQYLNWLKRKNLKVPEPFKKFCPRLVRLLKRLLEPKFNFRSEIKEVFKYLSDDWIKPSYSSRNAPGNCFTINGNGNGSFKQKKAVAKKLKNGKSNLIILTSAKGINPVSTEQSSDKENKKIINDVQLVVKGHDDDEDSENATVSRVEHWIATTESK